MNHTKTSHLQFEEKRDAESQEGSEEPLAYSSEEEKKTVWRLDIVLIPL